MAVVNEGGDADTNAAIACAILGAKYGSSSIQKYYIETLHNADFYAIRLSEFLHLAINKP